MGAMTARERIQARRSGLAADRSKGLKPYKFRVGKTLFRILPSIKPDADFERKYGMTRLQSFDGSSWLNLGDREITYGEKDPIRDLLWAAYRAAGNDKELKDHYYSMIGYPRHIFCALIIDDPAQPATEPVLIEIGGKAMDALYAQMEVYTDLDETHDLTSLDRGHLFQCERSGTTKNDTTYVFTVTPRPAPVGASIMQKAIDLDGYIASQFETSEQQALAFLSQLNAAAGLPAPVSVAGQIASVGRTALSAGVAGAPATKATGVSTAAVTSVLDDDEANAANLVSPQIEDAVIEPVVAEPEPVAAVAPTPPTAPVAAAVSDSSEIDDILSKLQ